MEFRKCFLIINDSWGSPNQKLACFDFCALSQNYQHQILQRLTLISG